MEAPAIRRVDIGSRCAGQPSLWHDLALGPDNLACNAYPNVFEGFRAASQQSRPRASGVVVTVGALLFVLRYVVVPADESWRAESPRGCEEINSWAVASRCA